MKERRRENGGWENTKTAQMFAKYAEDFPLYRETSRALLDLAEVKRGSVVADLGCGSGVMTRELLGRVGRSGKVYAVDASEEMLKQAKMTVGANDNVEFICSRAEGRLVE